jgi:hypothetical protein
MIDGLWLVTSDLGPPLPHAGNPSLLAGRWLSRFL